MPKDKVSCTRVTNRYTHCEWLCDSCSPAEAGEFNHIELLQQKLKLQIAFLEQTVGFPDPVEALWEGFLKRLDEEARGLFVQVWSLQGEIEWISEEGMMREG